MKHRLSITKTLNQSWRLSWKLAPRYLGLFALLFFASEALEWVFYWSHWGGSSPTLNEFSQTGELEDFQLLLYRSLAAVPSLGIFAAIACVSARHLRGEAPSLGEMIKRMASVTPTLLMIVVLLDGLGYLFFSSFDGITFLTGELGAENLSALYGCVILIVSPFLLILLIRMTPIWPIAVEEKLGWLESVKRSHSLAKGSTIRIGLIVLLGVILEVPFFATRLFFNSNLFELYGDSSNFLNESGQTYELFFETSMHPPWTLNGIATVMLLGVPANYFYAVCTGVLYHHLRTMKEA